MKRIKRMLSAIMWGLIAVISPQSAIDEMDGIDETS